MNDAFLRVRRSRHAAKHFAIGSLNKVLGRTNVSLVSTGSHMDKYVQVTLANGLQQYHVLDTAACKITYTYKLNT